MLGGTSLVPRASAASCSSRPFHLVSPSPHNIGWVVTRTCAALGSSLMGCMRSSLRVPSVRVYHVAT